MLHQVVDFVEDLRSQIGRQTQLFLLHLSRFTVHPVYLNLHVHDPVGQSRHVLPLNDARTITREVVQNRRLLLHLLLAVESQMGRARPGDRGQAASNSNGTAALIGIVVSVRHEAGFTEIHAEVQLVELVDEAGQRALHTFDFNLKLANASLLPLTVALGDRVELLGTAKGLTVSARCVGRCALVLKTALLLHMSEVGEWELRAAEVVSFLRCLGHRGLDLALFNPGLFINWLESPVMNPVFVHNWAFRLARHRLHVLPRAQRR